MDNITKIGFVLDDLAAGHVAYCCINACNSICKNDLSIEPTIFYQEITIPCLKPKFARFQIKDMVGFDGHLIAT